MRSFFLSLIFLLSLPSTLSAKDGVTVRISGMEHDKAERLTTIREVTKSSSRDVDVVLRNIEYTPTNLVSGYIMIIQVRNVSQYTYPSENYLLSNIKYNSMNRVQAFHYRSGGKTWQCGLISEHKMVTPTAKQRIFGTEPPMLALSNTAKTGMQKIFGKDYDNIRVKTDPQKSRHALEIQAEAFTLARDIYFSKHGETTEEIAFRCVEQ